MEVEGEGDFYHVALLIEHLKAEDVQLRINATKELAVIADALGPERVRGELLPFLKESTDDEDEVLLILAEQLGRLVDGAGGPEYAYHLLGPLEALAAAEESTVRDKAVESAQMIAKRLSGDHLMEHYVPLLRRLATRDWFTARISACSLFASIYRQLPVGGGLRSEMRELFANLCKDDTPMVRRVAAANVGLLAEEVEVETVTSELLPLFTTLSEDDQDSVRLQTVNNCASLARVLSSTGQTAQILPVVLDATNDRSWRVRWSAANKFHDLCEVLGTEVTNGAMCSAYEKLLQDVEAEVRTAAAFNVTKVSAQMDCDVVLSKIFPHLQKMVMDSCEHVRAALAAVIDDMSPVLGKDHTINHLLPLLLALLRDNNSEVRLNIISKLQAINEVIGVELLSQSLLPAIVDLAEDQQWRVRMAIIEHIPLLAQQLGSAFFNEKLCDLCMAWLGDDVFSIRIAATSNLKHLTDLFGSEWATNFIMPKVEQMHSHNSFMHRMTALYVMQVLAESLDIPTLQGEVLPLVLHMANDPVPNIRFNVSKTLERIAQRMQQEGGLVGGVVDTDIRPMLNTLIDDSDRDVRYFTRRAQKSLQSLG